MKTLSELGISPTPWEAEVFADGHYAYITARSVNGNKKIVGSEHSTADAHLIAAAPDLYDALEECERKLDACDPFCSLLERVRAVLAKAGGESEVAK